MYILGVKYFMTCLSSLEPLHVQVRKEDKNILVGLITRSSVLSWKLDGSPRNSQLWKHTLAVVMDWILTVSINSWLWRVLGISLIVINKNDILSKR